MDDFQITREHLQNALNSPLRLRLVAELLEVGSRGLTLDEAVLRSGRHAEDVRACLEPMVAWGLVEVDGDADARWSYRAELEETTKTLLVELVAEHSERIERDRHASGHLLGRMVGTDPKMQLVFDMVRLVARINVPVLITGETGTGKELTARSIHDLSPRNEAFFGAVNCATLPEELFASFLFGHVRGAFTSALQDHEGLIARCNEGTLFLDEVGELSLNNQAKLLRVLQNNFYLRVGDTLPKRSNFRLIAATNRDLQSMIGTGAFLEDLYYRLNAFPIRLPNLRERLSDLPYLIDKLLASHQEVLGDGPLRLTEGALSLLRQHDWPGNIRELENALLRAAILARGGPIEAKNLQLQPATITSSAKPPADASTHDLRSLAEVEAEHIERVLLALEGNIKVAAETLLISRSTLYKKIEQYNLGRLVSQVRSGVFPKLSQEPWD